MFSDVLDACGVLDLGGSGSRFTWKGPKYSHLDRVFKRLDRAVANDLWRNCFEEADVLNLSKKISDHCPVLVRLEKGDSCWREKPFRFMAIWQNDPRFSVFFKSNWDTSSELLSSLKSFTPAVKEWNKSVFGFILFRKNRVLARLDGIQKHMCLHNSWHLKDLEAKLLRELSEILDLEEQIWYQKSRGEWIKGGDRNTRFYHTRTLIRRKRNRILKLQNNGSGWVTGEENLIELARNFFYNLFKEDMPIAEWNQTGFSWPVLSKEDRDLLFLDISFEEVRKAFFQMPPLKAPGPDGFPALFYHKNWDLIKDQVFKSMKCYLKNPDQIKEINHTLLALIPKIERPCFMRQFRPIALCNTVYKGLSKILVNKIKPFIGNLISPNQVSFIPRRNIQDNIIIVQELIHSIHRMTGKKCFFSIKIDLEKAYDKLNWGFIRSFLEEVQLPSDLIAVVMGCVTTPFIEVLWNGSKTPGFQPQRGIRQGDPLSPYLFVLCMEKLTHLIMDEVGKKNWKPIKAGRSGPQISHLMFADDIILFAEASLSQFACISDCLLKFSNMSGQSVSMEKSCIYFSRNTSLEISSSIADISGFKVVKSIGCYLGALMRHGRASRKHYANIISRVQNRLQGWKAKCMSLAGRITLAKSVISAIPTYHMQNNTLPIHICQEIEELQCKFIWGDLYEKRRAHYVAWDQLFCGLKYYLANMEKKQDPRRGFIVKPSDSPLWKSICSARTKLDPHLVWEVGNGITTLFWIDCWSGGNISLFDLACVKPPSSDLDLRICDLVKNEIGGWKWDYLKKYLDDSTIGKLQGFLPPSPSGPNDRLCWTRNSSSRFMVRNAYCQLTDPIVGKDKLWSMIWKWKGPYIIATCLWLACLNKLPVRSITGLWSGGVTYCPSCYDNHETIMHVLRDCNRAKFVWECWFGGVIPDSFMTAVGLDWFRANICKSFSSRFWHSWYEIFFVTCWLLWRWRNLLVHDDTFSWPEDPMSKILIFLKDMKKSCSSEPFSQAQKEPISFIGCGNSMQKEAVKILVDGVVSLNTKTGACGGFLCNSKGEWISGFSLNIGICTSLEAELWGIWQGLQLAVGLKIQEVWVGCDSQEALLSINSSSESDGNSLLVRKIRNSLQALEYASFEYIPRKNNSCADGLAILGLKGRGGELNVYSSPPASVFPFWNDFCNFLLMEHVSFDMHQLSI
ncbi:uncharacterized protein LOC133311446 [Gastrolobium bilobum]|uniref:uncharacterized protein LOC133311446 n=1 Tax=Gastrolobium bilobum TaxID=150636 RepID=UPI002AB323D9|nr:uncharacterized protein LOC133311446 [Gastrolobium bilobum]